MKNLMTTIFLLPILLFICCNEINDENSTFHTKPSAAGTISGVNDKYERYNYEKNMLVDPASGEMPDRIRLLELEFAKTQPKGSSSVMGETLEWEAAGPYNYAGRTRDIEYDINNENILLAAAVSGGIWRSTDGGSNWEKTFHPTSLHSVTDIVQDQRVGNTNRWFAVSGESFGNSASDIGAAYQGGAIYRSSDNGLSWETINTDDYSIEITNSIRYQSRILVDPSNEENDILYIASYNGILRSEDDGQSWERVLTGSTSGNTDIAVSSNGGLFATVDGPNDRAYYSADGLNWINISPDGYPTSTARMIVAIDPNNENIVYFYGATFDGSGVFMSSPLPGGAGSEYGIFRYTLVDTTGNSATGTWENLSDFLPHGQGYGNDCNGQFGYNLALAVSPLDSNVILFGGNNLFRTTDRFEDVNNIQKIAGFKSDSIIPPNLDIDDQDIIDNNHVDFHSIKFLPEIAQVLIGSDGGLAKTSDYLADEVAWQTLNNGYQTAQFYHIKIGNENYGNNLISGGLQDVGTLMRAGNQIENPWTQALGADGGFTYFSSDGFHYASLILGSLWKEQIDENGNVLARADITPTGSFNQSFINPFLLDPSDDNILYYAAGNRIWRNDELDNISVDNGPNGTTGWTLFPGSVSGSVSCFTTQEGPDRTLYVGTTNGRIYKLTEPHNSTPTFNLFAPTASLGRNISSISIDPSNADHLIFCVSNYNSYSIYTTFDGGVNWEKAAGNLEENDNGTGNGPSCRWVEILNTPDGNVYIVGTSTGIYATSLLDNVATTWVDIGEETVGNIVVSSLDVRQSDGTMVLGTHGNGVYRTQLTSIIDVPIATSDLGKLIETTVFPNPASDYLYIQSDQNITWEGITIVNTAGQVLHSFDKNKVHMVEGTIALNIQSLSPGIYFLQLSGNKGEKEMIKFIQSGMN